MAISRTPRAEKRPMAGQEMRACEICGRVYRPHVARQRICSALPCRVAYKNQRRRERDGWSDAPRVCVTCFQTFTPTRSTHRICSEACRNSRYRRRAEPVQVRQDMPAWEWEAIDRKFEAARKAIRASRRPDAIDDQLRWNSALHGL